MSGNHCNCLLLKDFASTGSAPLNFSMSNASSSKPESTSEASLNKPTTSIAPIGLLSNQKQTAATSLTTSLPSSSAAPTFSFAPSSTSLSSSTATGFSFPGLKPATSTSTVTTTVPSIFGTPTALSSASSVSTAITSAVLSTTTTVYDFNFFKKFILHSTSSGALPATINFRQLEDSINKWKIELEEQEKVFLNQATQVNAWDRLLISNGEKITLLNDAVERVKLDQQRLDLELDFILAQQSELEELLNPLEKSIESTPNIHVQQHADLEREHT
ncbi:UNVERIFIED_CONTAM: Nup62 [Trichonephila clavipes]